MITLTNTRSTAEEMFILFSEAIRSGSLGDGERLPSIRQCALHFNVTRATATKAYTLLEEEGLTVSRFGSGTRVAPGASRAPRVVVERVRELVELAQQSGISEDDVVAVVSSLWATHNALHRSDE